MALITPITVSTTRDGVTGNVLTNVGINKSADRIEALPEGPVLLANVNADVGQDWQEGDYMALPNGTTYKVVNVEERKLIPHLRILVRGTMQL